MLKDQNTQIKLGDDGQIRYQSDPTNPLPGVAVAVLKKGPTVLRPGAELLETLAALPDQDKADILAQIHAWLMTHIATVLEPLTSLENDGGLQGAVQDIAVKVFDSMGIVPREQVQGLIAQLDAEGRKALRNKKIRLGPVLVFQPELNKPAAVRLRALLWTVYHGGTLPAPVPNDGAVSVKIDPAAINAVYYQSIGYPVYAARAIRIDMLDRVISAVYDNAKDGKFQAQHKMAEWLGCPIGDLYEILIAMGHQKVSDPAEQKAAAEAAVAPVEGAPAEMPKEEVKAEEPKAEAADAAPAPEAATLEAATSPAPPAKPELATFRLKKGRAFEKREARPPRPPRAERKEGDRPERKKDERNKGDFKKDGRKDFKKDRKPGRDRDRDRGRDDDREPRIVSSTGPKFNPADSPFAILEQLKAKKDAG